MPNAVERYFDSIAAVAARAVADRNNPPPVFATAQEPSSSAWTALAVHPMLVLETAYIDIVQAAEQSAGSDRELAQELGLEALSGFFALASDSPSLLGTAAPPLVEERLKDLAARLALAETMAEDAADGTYDELKGVVADAAELVAAITTADGLAHASHGVEAAARYLGGFPRSPETAAAAWAAAHPVGGDLAALAGEVSRDLVAPLLNPGNAAASPRCLYNIAPFYLYRLMHRFLGGDDAAPMDLEAKRTASGAATAAMHRADWLWLTKWHEERVVELKTALQALDADLRRRFALDDDIIRFHLKGGRAMFTALGRPQEGSNDWDTGILINPELAPERWYRAFAAVNDLVVAFLDRARFGYTELLNAHADELNAPRAASAAAADEPFDFDERAFSRHALLAEAREEAARRGGVAPVAALRSVGAAPALAARRRVRAVGVNGELIDVGISRRSSVELAEHWHDVRIVERDGVEVPGLPVPTLPYFIDDFSTIIREALATGTADRKLAKRLLRLKLVLDSGDALLAEALAQAEADGDRALPNGARKLRQALEAASARRLATWGLAALLQSLPDAQMRPGWLPACDAYLAAHADSLLDLADVEAVWGQLEEAIAEADRPACREILRVQNAAGKLARRIAADNRVADRAIGGPDQASAPLWATVGQAVESVMALNRDRFGTFFFTGILAARLQAAHAEIDAAALQALGVGGYIEIAYRAAGSVGAEQALSSLVDRLDGLFRDRLGAHLITVSGSKAVAVTSRAQIDGVSIQPAEPTVMVVRAARDTSGGTRPLDYIDGRPVASARSLTVLFEARAAASRDYDLRVERAEAAGSLRTQLLGRQLR